MTGASDAKKNRICAVVLNYFGSEKTRECLRSLSAEPLDRLYLVDNSADESEAGKLSAMLGDSVFATVRFPIDLLLNDKNLGFGAAMNAVLRADRDSYRHDYYLLMNNDALATPGLVPGLLAAAAEDPNRALIAPRVRWAGRDIRYFWYHRYLGHVSVGALPGSFPYLSGCCLLVDAGIAQDGRLFDEDFFMYGEDAELTARVSRAGRSMICADHLLAIHEGSGSSSRGSLFYEYHVARGHVLLSSKIAGEPWKRALCVLGRAAYLPARAIIRSVRYRSGVPLRALGLASTGRTIAPPANGAGTEVDTKPKQSSPSNRIDTTRP